MKSTITDRIISRAFYSHEFNKKLVLNTALFYTKGFGYYEEYKENQSFASYGLSDILVNAGSINIGGQNIPSPETRSMQPI